MTRAGNMAHEDQAIRSPWEAPVATALTDTDSRADKSDVWMANGFQVAS